jgi:membrane protease YdiL (CAAX protease family)
MKRIADWIKNHQVAAFFISTYAMTWTGLFLVYFLFPGNDIALVLLFPFILFSPALSAMVISGIAEPHPRRDSSRSRWIVFFLSWLLASTVLTLYWWKVQEMDLGLAVIVIYCIWGLFPAWMLSNAYAKTPGIRKQFSTLLKPRGSALWYMAIFLIYPGILLLSVWITRLLGGEVPSTLNTLGFKAAAIAVVLEFLRGFFMTGGINEESGWRGFALPRLQARYSVLASSLIVGVLWALWHLPYDLAPEDWRGSLAWFLEYRLFWRVVFGVILTWLYNRTNGSLLAPVLFHPVMNTFGNAFFGTAMSKVLCIALMIVAIVSDRMWERLPSDHPAVYRDSAPDNEASGEQRVPVLIYG